MPKKKPSKPMEQALEAVASMPVTKENKLEAIIRLLRQSEGATLDEMEGLAVSTSFIGLEHVQTKNDLSLPTIQKILAFP